MKLRDELTEEYERRLGEAEEKLRTELASREALEASLSNELQAKESLLNGEKKKLQDALEILENELQCSICSELFINVSTFRFLLLQLLIRVYLVSKCSPTTYHVPKCSPSTYY